MKRWALVVVLLYFLLLTALTLPVIQLAFGGRMGNAAGVYSAWSYWLWVAVMVVSQAALLTTPVRVASRRPVCHRSLLAPLLATGLMVGGLIAGAGYSVYEGTFGWDSPGGEAAMWGVLALAASTWCIWTLIFFRISRGHEATDIISRQCQLLLKGSILELLIAVPTHIVARSRDHCCAGFMTFIGLTMGLAVMAFSFGPAVFFLFVDRWKRLQPAPKSDAQERS